MKKLALLIGLSALGISSTAVAHTVWLRQDEARPNVFRVFFGGHAGAIDPYSAAKLKTVSAIDAKGQALKVTRSGGDNAVMLQVAGAPVMLIVHFDNGIHTKTGTGPSVPMPMNQVKGAISATSAVKYHKTIVAWGAPVLTRPVGQPFEVVPLSAAAPRAGQPMRIQVRMNGRPAAGVQTGRGEDTGGVATDAQGMATFVPEHGFNKIWAGKRIPTSNNRAYTELSYEYSLGFNAQ